MCGAQDLTKPSSPAEETAENLCVKKHVKEEKQKDSDSHKAATPDNTESPELDLSLQGAKDYTSSPPLGLPPGLSMSHDMDNHSPLPFPPMPSVSALAMTPPHSKCKLYLH